MVGSERIVPLFILHSNPLTDSTAVNVYLQHV
jgi:glutathione S-transferase